MNTRILYQIGDQRIGPSVKCGLNKFELIAKIINGLQNLPIDRKACCDKWSFYILSYL